MKKLAGWLVVGLMLSLSTPASAALSQFLGEWVSTSSSSGLRRVKISQQAGDLKIEVFGKCGGGECPWGLEDADAYASTVSDNLASKARAVTAIYTKSYKESIVVAKLSSPAYLKVEVFSRFLDSSGRTAYVKGYVLKRKKVPGLRLPDLVVTAIGNPVWDAANSRSLIKAQIKNIGQATSGESIARIMDYSTLQSTGAPQNSTANVGQLAPGQSKVVLFALPYDVYNPVAELEVTADYKGMVSESNENNNAKEFTDS